VEEQHQQDTPASRKEAPKKNLGFRLGAYDLDKVLQDDPTAEPLVNATPETDKRNTVVETPRGRNPSDEKNSPRINREPTDEMILEFLRITLPQLQNPEKESKSNNLFGSKNRNTQVHEITHDGLFVRGHTLAGPRAAAVTSD
jgi:hypothetical protein